MSMIGSIKKVTSRQAMAPRSSCRVKFPCALVPARRRLRALPRRPATPATPEQQVWASQTGKTGWLASQVRANCPLGSV